MKEKPKATAQISPEDYDFWHSSISEQQGESREVRFEDIAKTKGLWILTMEENPIGAEPKKEASAKTSPYTTVKQKPPQTHSVFQPTQPHKKPTVVEPSQRKDNFEAQRLKHQISLGERMQIANDGKRLPVPKAQPLRLNGNQSNGDLRRSVALAGAGESVLGIAKRTKTKH